MGTRGAIAVGNIKSWKGIYNHFDSYPTGLGCEVFKFIKKGGDVQKLIGEHPGGFRAFIDRTCYCHTLGEGVDKDSVLLTNLSADALFIEYVYIFEQETEHLHILMSTPVEYYSGWSVELDDPGNFKHIKHGGKYISVHSHCAYYHRHLFSIPIMGREPNWSFIEYIRNAYMEMVKV